MLPSSTLGDFEGPGGYLRLAGPPHARGGCTRLVLNGHEKPDLYPAMKTLQPPQNSNPQTFGDFESKSAFGFQIPKRFGISNRKSASDFESKHCLDFKSANVDRFQFLKFYEFGFWHHVEG